MTSWDADMDGEGSYEALAAAVAGHCSRCTLQRCCASAPPRQGPRIEIAPLPMHAHSHAPLTVHSCTNAPSSTHNLLRISCLPLLTMQVISPSGVAARPLGLQGPSMGFQRPVLAQRRMISFTKVQALGSGVVAGRLNKRQPWPLGGGRKSTVAVEMFGDTAYDAPDADEDDFTGEG